MQTQQHLNTFYKGQVQDIDKLQLGKESYLRSYGGRVVFNEDGTYAWENAKGTKFSFTLAANYGQSTAYQSIGGWQINGKLLIFSTDGTNSELGLVYEPTYGNYTYQTIFNDLYDPYGNTLGFSLAYQMRDCQVVVENDKVENAYFNDDNNEPRVFNVLLGLQSVSPEFTSGDYLPIGGATIGNVYPSFYSVHGMASMMDLTWGKLKFVNNQISGSLLSGEYQYAYRYVHRTGYVSPWSPLINNILLTTDLVSSNWTTYQMQQSGAQTNKGIELELKYIDQRYQEIEVAALYWQTNTTPDSAYIFFKAQITGPTMQIIHQFAGSTIAIDSLVQRYTEIKKAKTGGLKDNTYHIANFETFSNIAINTLDISIEPIVKPMLSDETEYEVASTYAPPFTNQTPKTTTITQPMSDGLPEVYSVYNDYINYKGSQWTTLFQGYFGGENYPFAIVLFDRKGQPCFAQHISDFSLPQRYSNEWIDRRINGTTTGTTGNIGDYKHTNTTYPNSIQITDTVYTSKWFLNLIGLNFNNIDLTDVLYDTDGNLQISGFSIVRMDRIKSILAQGLVMSAGSTALYKPTTAATADEQQFVSCPTMFNGYLSGGSLLGYPYIIYQTSGNIPYVGRAPLRYLGTALPDVNQTLYPSAMYTARPNMAFFESPDYMIDNTLLGSSISGDNMKIVGVCAKSYGTGGIAGQAVVNLQYESYYVKDYRTIVDQTQVLTADQDGSGTYNQTLIGDQVDIEDFYPNIQSGSAVFGNIYYSTLPPALDYMGWGNKRYLSNQVKPTCLFTFGYTPSTNKTTALFGVLASDEATPPTNYAGHTAYMICNYVRPAGAYTITESLLESRTYNNIGHFVPINQDIVDTITAIPANNGRCIFNNVNVWGGDCYLDYFTYFRLYAYLTEVNNKNQDYNIALSFPIESAFNIALRQGNTYERFGPTTGNSYNDGGTLFPDGLYYYDSVANKPEDFNVNNVLQPDFVQAYAYIPTPASFNEIYDYPVREAYTGTKIYGEKYDTYRKFPVNNFRDADGSKGEINSLQYIFNYLYIIQRSGFARVRFNDRELVTGQTGSSLDIGSALGLQGFDYISPNYGTQHQFSVVNTGRMIHFLDAEKGKHFRFAADGMLSPSDEYGHHTYFTNKLRKYWGLDNPLFLGGIASIFDYKNQSVYYTFTAKDTSAAETIEYSETSNQYKGFQPATPKLYMNFKQGFYSPDPSTPYKIYQHDEGIRGHIYGNYINSTVKFVVNPQPTEASWYDNGSIAVNNQNASNKIYSVTGTCEDMATQTVILPTDTRWRYLQGLVRYPLRWQNANTRLRGKSCVVEIEVTNDSSDTTVRISNHVTDYRLSPKL